MSVSHQGSFTFSEEKASGTETCLLPFGHPESESKSLINILPSQFTLFIINNDYLLY